MSLKYAENNIAQCWNCKNCVGHKETDIDTISAILIKNCKNAITANPFTKIILPECRVADQYMCFVYEKYCPYWEKF